MDFRLSEMHEAVRLLTRDLSEDILRKLRAGLDEREEYPRAFIQKLAEAGLLGIYIPEQYGGSGMGVLALCLVTEEVARVCLGTSTAYAANALGAMPILLGGTEEQKKMYLPKIASGEFLAAFGLTEAGAGSDALALKTRAVKQGGVYVVNGSKQFITNAGEADVYSVFAATNPERGARGISGFIVAKNTPGFELGAKEKKLGIRCSATRSLIFIDCVISAENLIGGREGWGSIILLNTLNRTRIGVGAQAVGAAQGAFEEALKYSRERKQFNRPIADFQAVKRKLFEMAMSIEAARSIVYKAAMLADSDAPKDTLAKFGATAKCFGSDVAMAVAVEAVQVFGGYGFSREYPIEKYFRDVKILQIYEGTNEIQRSEIAAILVKKGDTKDDFESVSGLIEADQVLNYARRMFIRALGEAKQNGWLPESAQVLRHAFADMDMKLEVARAFAERAAQLGDENLKTMALVFADESSRFVQINADLIISGDTAKYAEIIDKIAAGLKENISS